MAFNQFPSVTVDYRDTYEYESVNTTGNRVEIDMYDGDQKKAQSPMELLLTAVASCSAVDTVEILKKRKKTLEDFRIEASGKRRADHPRAFEEINLKFIVTSQDIKQEELEKNARMVVEKYCSVATTVSGIAKITISAVVNP